MLTKGSCINLREKISFRFFFLYSILEGVLDGVFLLNSYVFVKTLHGSKWQLGILFQVMIGLYLFSIVAKELTDRIKNKKRMLLWVGISTRLPLLIFFLFPENHSQTSVFNYTFLAIFLVFYSSRMIFFPSINMFLRKTFSDENFGKLFGYATTAKKITIMICTYLLGLLYDYNPFLYKYVYPALGILGIASIILFVQIPAKIPFEAIKKENMLISIKKSVQKMFALFKKNKAFARFETGFMLYGIAFMVTQPLIAIYFDEVLKASYSSFAFYQYYANLVAIATLPFLGKFIQRIDPRIFGILCYSSIFLFLLFFISTNYFQFSFLFAGTKLHASLLISFFFHGLFLSTMSLLYSIGSSYFCPAKEAYHYQSIHLTLTGVRALIFPLIGVMLLEKFGFETGFAVALIALIASIIVLSLSYQKHKLLS